METQNKAEMDDIMSSFRQLQEKSAVNTKSFRVASMNEYLEKAKLLPPLVVLYPNIVLEGDLCIIFGQSGIGKTIFAMQVAREIADKGKRVLYLDFEMSERQLALRYNTPNFPPTFFRAELRTDNAVDNVLTEIERAAVENHAEVLFIDNITALGQSLDKGMEAGTLMSSLNALKKEHGWTLVVLNHVPKRYSGSMPLSLEAIQGSAKLNQLVDDAIGLGVSSKDHSVVYVKQCKWRNGEMELYADHVALYERTKDEVGNLGFSFRDYGSERELLATETENGQGELRSSVASLHGQGYTQQQIADRLNISQSKVSRILKSQTA
jgi:predicted ATP-dependent serine protease/predicted XRE-type DNA-binding protein